VTQLHADIGWLLAGLVIALVLALRLSSAPRRAVWLGWLLLVLVGVQGSIGYGQYFSGLPAGVVWVHEVGAAAIWVTALLLPYALRERAPGFTDGSQARPAARNPAGIGSIGGEAPPRTAVPSPTLFSASEPSASDRDSRGGLSRREQ
jgi:cytochrome c oxidase assembly protein subunit 15